MNADMSYIWWNFLVKRFCVVLQKQKKENSQISDFQNIGNLQSHTEAVLHTITFSAHWLAYPNTYMCQTKVKYLITHMLSVGENQTGGDIFLSFFSPVEHRLLFPRQQKRRGKISRESRVVVLKIFISFFFLIICVCVKEIGKGLWYLRLMLSDISFLLY